MKRKALIWAAACLVLVAILAVVCLRLGGSSGKDSSADENWDYKPHLMVNGIEYWLASSPQTAMPDGFEEAGTITEEIAGRVSEDWQANGAPVGAAVYLNPEIPYQAYVNGKTLYLTVEADRRYIRYRGELYVYLGSVQGYEAEYYASYRNKMSLTVPGETAKTGAFMGTSVFDGYNVYPTSELGSNTLVGEHQIFRDVSDPAVLYALQPTKDEAWVYVRSLEQYP